MSDRQFTTVTVIQGDYAISDRPDVVMVTILGSCIATCLYDPVARIGGLNHLLLPEGKGADQHSLRYGLNLMELLINALLKRGADRRRLVGKLFGGSHLIPGLADIGSANARFAEAFLHDEGIPCLGKSTGGDRARRLRFWPESGRAQQLVLDRVLPDQAPPVAAPAIRPAGDIDFF